MRKALFPLFVVSLFMVSLVGFRPAIHAWEDTTPDNDMPGVVVLGSMADRYDPVTFDHEEHVDMADGCGDCHHQHGTEKTISCKECHKIDPSAFKKAVGVASFSSCKECHGPPFQPGNPGVPGLKAAYHRACFSCHREVNDVGIDPKGCTDLCHEQKKETAKKLDGTQTFQ